MPRKLEHILVLPACNKYRTLVGATSLVGKTVAVTWILAVLKEHVGSMAGSGHLYLQLLLVAHCLCTGFYITTSHGVKKKQNNVILIGVACPQ